jgi:hypothetical protein
MKCAGYYGGVYMYMSNAFIGRPRRSKKETEAV